MGAMSGEVIRSEFPTRMHFWGDLDQALVRFSQLEGFEVQYLRTQWFGEFQEAVESELPLMLERGLLYFSPF